MRGGITKTHNKNPIDIDRYILKEAENYSLPTEKAVLEELDKIAQKNYTLYPVDKILKGDMAVFSVKSGDKRFDKTDLKIVVGKNNFNREFEKAVLGMKVGETKTIKADGSKVEAALKSAMRKKTPEIGDELIKKENIENVSTVEEYKTYSFNQQKGQVIIDITNSLLRKIIETNEFEVDKSEVEYLVEAAMESCRAKSREEGKVFEEMTREELGVRVAAGSIAEFKKNCTIYYENYLKIAAVTALALRIPPEEVDISEDSFSRLWLKFRNYVETKLYGEKI